MGIPRSGLIKFATAGALTLTIIAGAQAAYADGSGTTTNVSYTDSSSTTNPSATSVVSTDVKGKVNLEYISKTGYKTSAKCVHVKTLAQINAHKTCVIPAKGMKLTNTGNGRVTKGTKFADYIGSKYTPVGTKFYYDKKLKVWREAICGNHVWFKGTLPKLKVSGVNLVKSFSNITATVTVHSHVSITGMSTVTVDQRPACYASGSGTYTATSDAYATASASARTQSEAISKALTNAKNLKSASTKLNSADSAMASAKASASSTATGIATSKATCTISTTPPVTPPTTPVTPPTTPPAPPVKVNHAPLVQITGSPALVYQNGNLMMHLEASDPDGDDFTVQLTATGGHTAGLVKVDTNWAGDACPTGKTCYDFRFWADNTPGNAVVTATVTDPSGATGTDTVTFPVVYDDPSDF